MNVNMTTPTQLNAAQQIIACAATPKGRQLISLPKYLQALGRSRIWGWRMRQQGLPSRVINGKPYAILPDADEWLMNRSTPDPVNKQQEVVTT